jgi:hypothetical protein
MPARPSELLGRMYRRVHDHSLGNAVTLRMHDCMYGRARRRSRAGPCVRVATLVC